MAKSGDLDQQLAEAIGEGDVRGVASLLEQGASAKARWGHQRRFALHWVTGKRDAEQLCRLLVSHGADANAMDMAGQTALHVAASEGHLKAVTVLLSLGADPNLKDYEGKTAMDWAFGLDKDDAVRVLSPLTTHEDIQAALIAGETDRVKELLNKDPSWATRKTSINGNTLLHDAVRLGYRDLVDLLLANGADANARSYTTPLKMARARRFHEIAESLQRHGAKA